MIAFQQKAWLVSRFFHPQIKSTISIGFFLIIIIGVAQFFQPSILQPPTVRWQSSRLLKQLLLPATGKIIYISMAYPSTVHRPRSIVS
jgi:hypothetical protein